MNIGIELIFDNLAVSMSTALSIVMALGCLIVMAKDFKLGLIFMLLLSVGFFVWFYEAGYNYLYPLYGAVISIVLLAFSLYFTSKTSTSGGIY